MYIHICIKIDTDTAYKKQNLQLSFFIAVWVGFLKEKSDFTFCHLNSSFINFYDMLCI